MSAGRLVAVFLIALAGCAAGCRAGTGYVDEVVRRSASFARLRKHAPRIVWHVEEETEAYAEVYLGEELDTHTVRHETLRVYRDGRVLRQVLDERGELAWVPDASVSAN